MSKITPFDYQGQAVAFNAEGWINTTDAAARFGKRPADWLALEGTRDYMEAMASALGLESKVSQNHFGSMKSPATRELNASRNTAISTATMLATLGSAAHECSRHRGDVARRA